jgi:hypothetical protein
MDIALENPLALNKQLFAVNFARLLKNHAGPLTFFRMEKLPHGMVRVLHR